MDDILIYGQSQAQHDTRLQVVIECLSTVGVTLNSSKCEFSKNQLIFLGHVITQSGVSADSSKTDAINHMEIPKSVSELRRFLGIINQLGNFSPNITHLSQPLQELLSTKRVYAWGPAQNDAFSELKQELTTPGILTHYNPNAKTKISRPGSSPFATS